ncbi:glycosyltransferase [Falsiroseomonas tokyonensis]|uniref:Glycosyltransferase n=1 Tax=Falsiroseomonas tokyonensis TaxID=430521 RepID=A0ABV7C3J6_9PROT|nr:glycosyltransferase [Falsiroseomonas tokyonensis]MBU8541467.1 glycosyltransferase [Falsiroseomonas tokyonensis]
MNAIAPPLQRPAPAQPGGPALEVRHLAVADGLGHPSEANGVHNVARALVREQRAAGDRASLVLLARGDVAPALDPACPTRIVRLEGPALRGRTVRLSQAAIEALLAGAGPGTLCHIHGGREPMLPGLGQALRRRGIPYAITVHGRFSHIYDPTGRTLKRSTALYLRLFERRLLEGARVVQALSEEEAAILRRVAPRARIAIIGNGAWSSRLGAVPAAPAVRQPSAAFPHFAYCGRYAIAHKGLDLLLEGFAAYASAGGAGRLTMLGSGPAQAELARMASRLGIAGRVTILGPHFGDMRDAVLRECDYFVMASRYEGVPLAALEAGLLGLPLIVTAGTGLRAAVVAEQAGLPIAEHSAAAVAAALHAAEALTPAEWQARAAAAHALVLRHGDWTEIAARLRRCCLP